jgi:protein SCO1/2
MLVPDSSVPNVTLRTQDDIQVRFYDDLIGNHVVMINFFFTSCTTVCPRTIQNLVKVQDILADRLGRDVRIISITVDPDNDTPSVLKKYATEHRARPGWYFVTGKGADIDFLRRRLGVTGKFGNKTKHAGILVYGNGATDQWAATPALAEPAAIVRSVIRLVKPTVATPLPLDPQRSGATS